MIIREELDTKPWYRQFWPWFIIALPLSAVIGGLLTLKIAIDNPDGLVVDDYYKAGLAINKTLDRDHLAAQLGVSALLRVHPAAGTLTVDISANQAATGQQKYLDLKLVHPTRAHLDQTVKLTPTGDGRYEGQLPVLPPGNWHLVLTPPNDAWRLTGRLKMPQGGQARLAPDV